MLRIPARYAMALALAALFVACKKDEEAAASPAAVAKATATPQAAIESAVEHLKTGNIKALVLSQVPPDHVDEMRANWQKELAEDPPTEQEKQEFEAMMAELTAPDAEAKLMEKLEPQLVKFETEYAPQLPMMIGMGQGLLQQGIKDNKDLTEPQKLEAAKSVDALAKWIQSVKFSDRALAREAVGHVVNAARELDLETLDQARALDFDTAMEKSGIAYRAAKKVLEAYGLSLDKTLDSVRTEVISQQGDNAKVKVSYTMFEQPMSFETELVRIDGRWYGKQAIEELNKPDEPEISEDDGAMDDDAIEEDAPSEPVEG
ncbi:MAG TPA: hypothetical protein VFO79_15120 [Xanthomonadales bacterium]|nr:hypothetical protein [Xanthomonadales bacterium]